MAYDPYPGMGIRTWHVAVFLGLVVLVADIVSIQMVGNNSTESFRFVAGSKPETVEVLVAAKDLPVGTRLTREDLASDKFVMTKSVPKGNLPTAFVTNRGELADKRLTRAVRAEEMLNPQNLSADGKAEDPVEVAPPPRAVAEGR